MGLMGIERLVLLIWVLLCHDYIGVVVTFIFKADLYWVALAIAIRRWRCL